jgi:hypothetical protein
VGAVASREADDDGFSLGGADDDDPKVNPGTGFSLDVAADEATKVNPGTGFSLDVAVDDAPKVNSGTGFSSDGAVDDAPKVNPGAGFSLDEADDDGPKVNPGAGFSLDAAGDDDPKVKPATGSAFSSRSALALLTFADDPSPTELVSGCWDGSAAPESVAGTDSPRDPSLLERLHLNLLVGGGGVARLSSCNTRVSRSSRTRLGSGARLCGKATAERSKRTEGNGIRPVRGSGLCSVPNFRRLASSGWPLRCAKC